MISLFALLVGFQVKHFLADFLWQYPRHYKNKGTYGHWGGIEHALIHSLATFVLLSVLLNPMFGADTPVYIWLFGAIALIEGIIHYHIDWFKMNYNKKRGWGPTTHEEFWHLLGYDQMMHQFNYIGNIWVVSLFYNVRI